MSATEAVNMMRLLADGEDGEHFGVHIAYADLFMSMVFLACIYMGGVIAVKFCAMPSLVGEIFIGILFGPSTLALVPAPEAFVLLGEIGLILLVLEAGIDIDLTTIKLIGTRGILIAVVGSVFPILIASGVAFGLGYSSMAALAAGCTFAPTSLGIAMNILRQSNIVNTPVGQLIVAAAIIDDMIALVILSQLQAFASESVTIVDILVPVISAIGFLVVGGSLAVFVLPKFFDAVLLTKTDSLEVSRGWVSMAVMFGLLLLFMPMTFYARASPLMGAFLAGLVFCSNHDAHHTFVSQMKRVMQWLLRIFFAASIGFQVPIKNFASVSVVCHGLLFTLALLGKLFTGIMVPNFSRTKRFTSVHLRDCFVVGFSMVAEGEFAFVIAVFAATNGMLNVDQYASVVLAVLLSTVIAPFCLRFTIARFNKLLKDTINEANGGGADPEAKLEESIRKHTALFYCIQTKSSSSWGLQMNIMEELSALSLSVIDHRSFHNRNTDGKLVNEVYVQDPEGLEGAGNPFERDLKIENRAKQITEALLNVIGQEDAMVRTTRWIPVIPDGGFDRPTSVTERIVRAAGRAMDRRKSKDSLLPRDYSAMDPPGNRHEHQINHLDENLEGLLEGFFRHDTKKASSVYRPYQSRDGVELIDDASIDARTW